MLWLLSEFVTHGSQSLRSCVPAEVLLLSDLSGWFLAAVCREACPSGSSLEEGEELSHKVLP